MNNIAIKFELTGYVHSASIASLDADKIKEIKNSVDNDFNMVTDNSTLNKILYESDILFTEGFCANDFNLLVTVFEEVNDNESDCGGITAMKSYSADTLLQDNAKYKMRLAEKPMMIGGLYLVECSKLICQTWTGLVKLSARAYDPKKMTVNVVDFENPHTQLPSFIIEQVKYNGKAIDFKRDSDRTALTKHYDIVRFNGGRGDNRYKQIKLNELMKEGFDADRMNQEFTIDRYKHFSTHCLA